MKIGKFILLTFGFLLPGLLLCQSARAAVGLTITPSAVSNTYSGKITLQVTGISSGGTVVIQKFLDANTNGVIDAGDLLVQQFSMTDGQASVFHDGATAVTNFNVPGDADTTGTQITAPINFQNGDFSQNLVGRYLYKLSSSSGSFTNALTVTNFPYAGSFTGGVFSNNTATVVPNAVVILFQASGNGNLNAIGGAVANNSGGYIIKAPPGTYLLAPISSNYVANLATAPTLTLASATITTNLTLTNATQSISGKIVDANTPSIGLPGYLVPIESTNNFLAVGFTDTNGNFTIETRPDVWKIQNDSSGLIVHGYVALQGGSKTNTAGGSISGITNALPKATAIFYGSVKDNLGNPLAGIDISGSDDNNQYQSDGFTDANGNYVAAALAAQWNVNVSNDSSPTNYNFSGGFDTTLTNGQAQQVNFTAILATNHINGNVSFNGNPVSGVQVNASSEDANNYQSQATTDSNGNYSLNVASDTWNVSVNCNGGDGSLDGILGNGNYTCPCGYSVTISNNNATTNFTVLPGGSGNISGYITNSAGSPIVGVSVSATDCNGDNDSTFTDGSGHYSLNVANNIYDVSVDCGGLNSLGYQCVSDQSVTVSGGNVQQNFIPQSSGSQIQITTSFLPNGTNGTFYTQTLQASGGTPPYSWSIPSFSASPPANLSLAVSGLLSGTPSTTASTYYFDVIVTDAAANTAELDALPLTIVNPPLPALVITNISLPNGNVSAPYSAQLGATGGQSPYTWALALGSANPPPGLSLNSSGLISGVPTNNGLFSFKVQATDANSAVTNKVFGIIVNPRPSLSSANWLTNLFQMRLAGASNQNYTVQVSTNLSSTNWTPLLITNNPLTNSFFLIDPNATNRQRFYRILIGP